MENSVDPETAKSFYLLPPERFLEMKNASIPKRSKPAPNPSKNIPQLSAAEEDEETTFSCSTCSADGAGWMVGISVFIGAGAAGLLTATATSGFGGSMANPLANSSVALASRILRSLLPMTMAMIRTPPFLAVAAMEKPAASK